MSVSVYHPALNRKARGARRLKLDAHLTADPSIVLVPSSRGVCIYHLTIKGDEVECQCMGCGPLRDTPCVHVAIYCDQLRPDIARRWLHADREALAERRIKIITGKVNPRRFPKVRKVMDELELRFSPVEREEAEGVPF